MKTLNIILLVTLVISLAACEGAKEGASSAEQSPPIEEVPDQDNVVTPTPSPTPALVTDHSDRSPEYGSEITESECEMLSTWVPGVNETWYFGPAFAGGGTTQNQADAYNDLNFYRFDRDGVVWRRWVVDRFVNQYLYYQIVNVGKDCKVEIINSTSGIARVWWQNVLIN